MGMYAIKASKFVLPGAVMGEGYLPVEDGAFGIWQAEAPSCDIVDYAGKWVAPGMVDTHIHGFYGHATTDVDAEGLLAASMELARRGTTSWLPTTFTDDPANIGRQCAAIAEAEEKRELDATSARIQGIFLEGPFFTEAHVGAQNPAYLIDPSYDVYADWQEQADGLIVKSALAAEKPGALEYIAALDAEGVKCAIGHSDATFEESLAAVNAGASLFVHTYNGQRGLHHREAGVVGCAMATSETYAELICDGKHVSPAAIKALVNAKGWQHVALITDCLACGGLPEGNYESGGMPVVLRDGLCYLRNEDGTTGSIAGSVLTLARGVKNMVDWGIVGPEQAIRMATEVPARSAGIEGFCGSIIPGRDADFVVLEPDMTLVTTYVGGTEVPQAE